MKRHVLIINGNNENWYALASQLDKVSLQTDITHNPEKVQQLLKRYDYQSIIIERDPSHFNTCELIESLIKTGKAINTVVICNELDDKEKKCIEKYGGNVLWKPYEIEQLIKLVSAD